MMLRTQKGKLKRKGTRLLEKGKLFEHLGQYFWDVSTEANRDLQPVAYLQTLL